MKQLFVILVLASTVLSVHAQQDTTQSGRLGRSPYKTQKRQHMNALMKLQEEQDPVFRKQSIFGIKAASDGYGISYEFGKYKGPKKVLIFQAELNEKKNPKEEKTASGQNIFGQTNSFIYAKANNFYQFKLSVGQQFVIGGKANKNGVNVSAIYDGGISLGIVKPYYITITNPTTGDEKKITFSDTSDYTGYQLEGASGFTYGWNKAQLKPGLHAKGAMRFDYGHFNETISAVEAGVNLEYYFSDIQQLILVPSKRLFFNGYVTILFGKRK